MVRGPARKTQMVPVERLVLTARVEQEDATFVASVDGIDVQVEGESADVAREELIQAMLIWISARDCTESMAVALTEAGFPEIDDETELHLEFLDSPAGFSGSALREAGEKDASGEKDARG